MVKVQMRIDHHVDVVEIQAMLPERFLQGRCPFDRKHRLEFRILLIAEPRIHQEIFAVRPDQEAGQAERDAIQFISRTAFLPQGFRHHAKHGAAVQSKSAVDRRVDVEGSEFHNTTGSR